MTTTIAHKNQEQQLRRALNKHGYSLHKMHPNRRYRGLNLGGYMIVWDKYRACLPYCRESRTLICMGITSLLARHRGGNFRCWDT